MELFDLKVNVKRQNIFWESILLGLLKISMSLKKTFTTTCLEILFSKDSHHIETSWLIALQINWHVSLWYNFSLKSVSEQVLIITIVINCRIILDLYDINSTNQGYYTVWKLSVFRVILVCIFQHSDWIRRDTEYLSTVSPNAGKCGPE